MKKGQVATEFLTTYGWAIMLILLAMSVLFYFGFFDIDVFIEDSCFFGQNFGECDEFTRVGDKIFIKLTNNGLQNLTFHACNVSVQDCETSCSFDEEDFAIERVWEPYTQKVLSFSCPALLEDIDSNIELTFSLSDSDRIHSLKGKLISSMKKQDDIYNENDILGCTTPTASNYDPEATVDDGSCEYLPFINSFSINDVSDQLEFYFPEGTPLNFEFVLYDHYPSENMEAWFTGPLANLGSLNIPNICISYSDPLNTYSCGGEFNCPGDEPCQFTLTISNVPGLSEGEYEYDIMLTQQPGTTEFTDLAFNINFYDPYGCTDSSACNYDPAAEIDDNSCESTDTYYLDWDGDSFGDPYVGVESCGYPDCDGPENEIGNPTCYSNAHGDCDDTTSLIHPNIIEDGSYCFDDLDNDCDGFIDFCSIKCDEDDLPPGTSISGCGIKESACDDGLDNDNDGNIDLCDSDCGCGSAIKIGCECYNCDIEPYAVGSVYCFDPGSSINLEFSLINSDTGSPLSNCNSVEFHENLGTNNVYYNLLSPGCTTTLNLDEALGNLGLLDIPRFKIDYAYYDYSSEATCGFDIYNTGNPECT